MSFLEILGGLVLLYCFVYIPAAGIYRHFFRKSHDLKARYGAGSWALITGSSDGIGKSFAYKIAQEGFNLFLISRTESKLAAIAKEIEQKYSVKVKYLALDFGKSYEEKFYDVIFKETKDLDISFLINNVGMSARAEDPKDQVKHSLNTVITNCCGQTILQEHFAPIFAKRQNKSGIINVSSVAGGKPISFSPLYSATKGFNDFLSRAAQWDYEGKIDIMSLRPGWVSTNILNNKKPTGFTIISDD
mmetsp:Transcript_3124/g.2844  ORF Transcript_3124/g.2844 Transcript_3124/m.2844 type:complete len:246 (-) Transcript_3124:174-911(-)|eukprot:CAMPEP_0197006660 /NCGR_PEP_ID=MMETSP1380-20130617/36393_1 /TAXON_ID=5936 /ORGANISM="Euplotes crassus, Strain CT5" /LENGTH=245 /DNA_ID=CAMNT_0042426337 /DNA_START=14 /DNA_END=751 /DNA_ORIENTATION=+